MVMTMMFMTMTIPLKRACSKTIWADTIEFQLESNSMIFYTKFVCTHHKGSYNNILANFTCRINKGK